ncbi:hypothetical protein D3C76_424580 [compost metagenome]
MRMITGLALLLSLISLSLTGCRDTTDQIANKQTDNESSRYYVPDRTSDKNIAKSLSRISFSKPSVYAKMQFFKSAPERMNICLQKCRNMVQNSLV